MAELVTSPQDSWHHVFCRICAHPFDITIANPEDPPAPLCQTCSILVDWLGQEKAEAAPNHPDQSDPDKQQRLRRSQAGKETEPVYQEAGLANLLEKWAETWRSGEGQKKRRHRFAKRA